MSPARANNIVNDISSTSLGVRGEGGLETSLTGMKTSLGRRKGGDRLACLYCFLGGNGGPLILLMSYSSSTERHVGESII